MNRIVKHHVPVGELPEHLREGLDPAAFATVEVTVEPDRAIEDDVPMSLDEIFGLRDNFSSSEDVAAYVRSLREEWAHRER
ncbi:hypothetical protein [Salinarimonas rosea]|uniref:hypothetical protein n=1 Tax=Salinarimonas rosea TaxID=552063 RepID=UPI0004111A36|nr:hypothetical protein [Salinarimonas rosea]